MKAKFRHQKCIHRLCLECCQHASLGNDLVCKAPRHRPTVTPIRNTSSTTPNSEHSTPSTPTKQPSSSAGAYGRMLSPVYQRKLEDNDFTFPIAGASGAQRNRYRVESEHTVRVKWWNKVRLFFVALFALWQHFYSFSPGQRPTFGVRHYMPRLPLLPSQRHHHRRGDGSVKL